MILYPNAKINIGLIIKGKRPDGYHLLDTVMYPVMSLCDELSLEKSETDGCQFSLEGMELDGDPHDNLCVRAYTLLRAACPSVGGVRIVLKKRIPAGAGLGGGSSDAAFTLRGLNELFDCGLSVEELAQLAAQLGADVPFFLYNRPLLATGIGTAFEEIDIDLPYDIRLVPSSIHSSTVAAYRALDYRTCDPARDLRQLLRLPVSEWKTHLPNDLEVPVFGLYPSLAETKQQLYNEGAVYAAMSGSGSAVFGLFPKA